MYHKMKHLHFLCRNLTESSSLEEWRGAGSSSSSSEDSGLRFFFFPILMTIFLRKEKKLKWLKPKLFLNDFLVTLEAADCISTWADVYDSWCIVFCSALKLRFNQNASVFPCFIFKKGNYLGLNLGMKRLPV